MYTLHFVLANVFYRYSVFTQQAIKILNVEVFQDPLADVEKEIADERRAKMIATTNEVSREERKPSALPGTEETTPATSEVGRYLRKK